jgi:hypothetical protein
MAQKLKIQNASLNAQDAALPTQATPNVSNNAPVYKGFPEGTQGGRQAGEIIELHFHLARLDLHLQKFRPVELTQSFDAIS